MQVASLAVLWLLVASGCTSKTDEAPAPAPANPHANVQATQQRAAHLKSIEIDLTAAEAARKASPLAPPAAACTNAKLSLIALSQESAATIDPLSARYDAACSAIAVDKLDLPADLLPPAKAVQDALPEIDAAYRARNVPVAEARCMTLVDHVAKLEPSKIVEINSLRHKADTLCNLLVPVATLEAAVKSAQAEEGSNSPACGKQLVLNAYTRLAHAKRLESPAVSPLVEKWNATCPQSVLAK